MKDPTMALLELFAVCDDVFSEEDRFASETTMRMSLGRIYRQWKSTTRVMHAHAKTYGGTT